MARETSGVLTRMTRVMLTVILAVTVVYFGREVLLPLSLAVLLTFALAPLVTRLEHRGLPRVPAVVMTVTLVFGFLAIGGWLLAVQLDELAGHVTEYKDNLKDKLQSIHFARGGTMEKLQQTAQELTADASKQHERVQTVRVEPESNVPWASLELIVSSVIEPLTRMVIVTVLVIFMLVGREDLRNRLVRLAGKRLTLTTRALDEIGTRISRYLLMNLLVNGCFGAAIGVGLWTMGVHYALMWGILAGILRFLPYIGPVLGAVLPLAMTLIQFPGIDWMHPVGVIALFAVVELMLNSVVEPLLYGHSAGVSTVALLVSATFWAWVWGPAGLILSVPLTVALAVLGEHVPALEPLAILLGDKPPLAGDMIYYQRLLAGDVDEAAGLIDEQHRQLPLVDVYDKILVPALLQAVRDQEAGDLSPEEHQFVWQTTAELLEEHAIPAASQPAEDRLEPLDRPQVGLKSFVAGVPANDLSDELALAMLQQTTLRRGGEMQILPASMLVSEMIEQLRQRAPDVVCISALGPLGVRKTRYLCKRLQQALPPLRIVVGRWGFTGDREKAAVTLRAQGADQVVFSLDEARDLLSRILPLNKTETPAPTTPEPALNP